jgi:hypothetical protein
VFLRLMNIRLQEHDEAGRAPNERGHRVVDQVPWTTPAGVANFKSVEGSRSNRDCWAEFM